MGVVSRAAEHTFDALTSWMDAWGKAREQGWETILVDGRKDGLSALMFHPAGGSHQELLLTPADSFTIPLPQDSGLGEAIWSLSLAVEDLPWLGWDHPYRDLSVLGKGIFTYPLGPVRGDVSESVFYRLQVMGDDIVRLTVENGFKRRHIRQLCRGRSWVDALPLVERMTTTSTVAHALAFSLAVEDAFGWSVAPQATWIRTLVAELERMASHAGDLASLAASTGLPVPQMEYLAVKELVLGVNFDLFGHRYLRGVIVPGGVRAPSQRLPQSEEYAKARRTLSSGFKQVQSVRQGLDRTPSFLDRLHGAGTIPTETREFVRPVGPIGRSAGRPMDGRSAHPYLAYDQLEFHPPALSEGDAFARYVVKAEELAQSFAMVLEILKWPERLSAGTESDAMHSEGRVSERRTGRAWIEAPRGLMAYRVELAEDGKLNHLGIATPSQRNWYVVAPAMANQNILQDFPIIDASFNLSIAGWDG